MATLQHDLPKNQNATNDGDINALSNLLDSETVPGQQYLLETPEGIFPLLHTRHEHLLS